MVPATPVICRLVQDCYSNALQFGSRSVSAESQTDPRYTDEVAGTSVSSSSTLKGVVLASLIGTTVEWYDFSIFTASSALVFQNAFFPNSAPNAGILLAFLTYAVGFAARPIGAILFGHLGDRIGRKPVLVITFVVMGGATMLMGLLPTYAMVGSLAPVLLVSLRCIQGIALGGEFGGAALLTNETAPEGRRGLFSSSAMVGLSAGILLGSAVFALFAMLPRADFLAWGWRIPFLSSLLLVLLGLWVRSRVAETPAFRRDQARAKPPAAPLFEVLRHSPKRLFLVFGARVGETTQFNITSVFALHFATSQLGISPSLFLSAVTIANIASIVLIPTFGSLSDRVGRRPVALFGGLAALLGGAIFFPMLHIGSAMSVISAVMLMIGVSASLNNAVPASWFPELFPVAYRYTGVSVGYQLGTVAGGFTPAVSTLLFAQFGVTGVAIYLTAAGALITLCVWLLPETSKRMQPGG
jgi:MHS family shikimate/dehydroshikimate transporter-like MFS transporter